MTKIIILLLTLVFGTSYIFYPVNSVYPVITSSATSMPNENESVYACILTDAYLYERESDDSGLFLLPKTYFVKILTTGIRYSYVQYLTDSPPFRAVFGYCKTAELTFVDFQPVLPYLYLTVDVDYSMSGPGGFKGDSVWDTVQLTYVYYGDYVVGSTTFCYVQREGEFGYLPKTMEISYDKNEEFTPLDDPKPTPPPTLDDPDKAKLIIFSMVTLLSTGLGYFLFRPKKSE